MRRYPNLVSVIIPCYNHGMYIHEAIDSILNQTYQNFEIIIVDDGSDDEKTRTVLKEIDTRNTRVYYKENGDVASARNYGIKRSKGEYILTLDSDDKFAPTFIEKALHTLDSLPETGMVTCYVKRFGDNEVSTNQFTGGDVSDFLVKNNAVSCLLFRYECWMDAGGYDEGIPGYEDWEFAINVTKQGWTVYSIPEYLFYYRRTKGSMYDRVCHKRPEIIKYMVQKHRELFKEYTEHVIYTKEKEIKELKETVELFKNSAAVKIGSFLLAPFRWFKRPKKNPEVFKPSQQKSTTPKVKCNHVHVP